MLDHLKQKGQKTMNYNIEIANINDLNDIYCLQNGYKHLLISKDSLKSDLENDNCIYFVAKSDNKLLSCIGATILFDHIDISIVITDINYQKKGIASALLNQVIRYAKDNNIEKIYLEVRASNLEAIKLYEKYNLKQISIRKNYYSDTKENALIYMLEI